MSQSSPRRTVLYHDIGEEPNVEMSTQLANEIYNHDLLPLLILNMRHFEFEVGTRLMMMALQTGQKRLCSNIQQSIASSNWK